mmetsp:Transcript_51271/g.120142  ORF Transcript_51271/g.120142 Transcript_51271/m.120142 type:complete len:208 (+) Transcript_51271:1419-2042(+)
MCSPYLQVACRDQGHDVRPSANCHHAQQNRCCCGIIEEIPSVHQDDLETKDPAHHACRVQEEHEIVLLGEAHLVDRSHMRGQRLVVALAASLPTLCTRAKSVTAILQVVGDVPTVVELGNVDGHEVGQVLEDDHDAVEEDIVHGTFNGDLVAFKDLRLVIQKPEQDVTEGNSSVSHHSCGEVCQESNHVFCLTIHLRTTRGWDGLLL